MISKLEELLRTEARKALDETIAEMLGRDADAEETNDWQPPPGTEWAIVRESSNIERWLMRSTKDYWWGDSPFHKHSAARFKLRRDAENYITRHGLTDCQPWPVPAS